MTHLDLYSHDYTLNGLVEVGYLDEADLQQILENGATKEQIVKAVEEILLND